MSLIHPAHQTVASARHHRSPTDRSSERVHFQDGFHLNGSELYEDLPLRDYVRVHNEISNLSSP
jgi:hypothetical protein